MKTVMDERIMRMHARAAELQRQKEKRTLRALGTGCGGLLVCLVAMIRVMQQPCHEIAGGGSAGASLLEDSAGGYVLVAVIAFVAGMVITSAIRWYRSRSGNRK